MAWTTVTVKLSEEDTKLMEELTSYVQQRYPAFHVQRPDAIRWLIQQAHKQMMGNTKAIESPTAVRRGRVEDYGKS